jgi:O-antigen ligase|nr:O-antigen ligase family protein [uncultured Pseudoxanthomonas sp.]
MRSCRRQDVARGLAWLAGFSAATLLVVPKGLSVFAVLMLAATVAALPDLWRGGRVLPRAWYSLLATALIVVAIAAASMWARDARWASLDNPSRALLLPWCAWLAWTTRVRMSSLWYGALAGLLIACTISIVQVLLGVERAGSEANPIVFANAVLVLLVVAVFCRPPHKGVLMPLLLVGVIVLANVAVILSGSRGALLGLGLVVLMLLVGGTTRYRWRRLGIAGGVLATLFVALWTVPWLSTQFRLDQLHADVSGYALGQVDQPISARLGLLTVAWDAFRESPLTGIGIDAFEARIDASVYCRGGERHFCGLEHAHNDLAQWGATMGVAGIFGLLALYLVPLSVAAHQIRVARTEAAAGAPWAAGMLVATYMVSGLTQSMFSHALSTSAYVVLVGLLLGIGMQRE